MFLETPTWAQKCAYAHLMCAQAGVRAHTHTHTPVTGDGEQGVDGRDE